MFISTLRILNPDSFTNTCLNNEESKNFGKDVNILLQAIMVSFISFTPF